MVAGGIVRALQGKVALVTGSTSGIGLGISKGLAKRGCSIILNGFADENLITKLKSEFSQQSVQSEYVNADLTKSEEVEALVDQIKKLHPGGVDILVNNAGFQHVSPIEEFSLEKWNAMIGVMLTAPFQLIQSFLPNMRNKGWGRIVNLASVHGLRASPNKAGYVSAKHGILGLTKVVALETAGSGVTCNAVSPGYVDTPILQGQVETLKNERGITYEEAEKEFLNKFHPSGQPIGIEQLADAVAFICSDAAAQMTGVSLTMDGGWTAK